MDYSVLLDRYRSLSDVAEVTEYASVLEGGRHYPLVRVRTPGRRTLLITSGFHGEEPAGPLTLSRYLRDVIAEAREVGVGILAYPCINPSGFEDGRRYNRSNERPNNDFLRYEMPDGTWKDEIAYGERTKRWVVYDGGPKETRAVRADLVRQPPPDAALDIHQDAYLNRPLTYAYTFGDRAAFLPLAEASEKLVPVAREWKVDEQHVTDKDGLIHAHDGSVTDWAMRLGVPYAAALETTTETPLDTSHAVNLLWIRGFVRLAARGR